MNFNLIKMLFLSIHPGIIFSIKHFFPEKGQNQDEATASYSPVLFLKAGFHWRWCQSQSLNQKGTTGRSSENSLLIHLMTVSRTIWWKLGCLNRKKKRNSKINPSPSASEFAWQNSQQCKKPPLVSPRNEVCGMSAKIPYWWRVTTQIWVVPASDLLKICFMLQTL